MVSEMDDRGQLLLAGALLIAVVIVGSIVLLNGVQFADATGAEGSQGAVRNAERLSHMIEQDVEELVRQVRASEPNNLSRALQENLSAYNRYYSAMQISDGAVFVNLSLNVTDSRGGLINETNRNFDQSRELLTNAAVLGDADFEITKLQGGGGNAVEITISDENTSDYWRIEARRTAGGGSSEIIVSTEDGELTRGILPVDPGPSGSGELSLDLREGTASGGGTTLTFDGFPQHVTGNYTVDLDAGNNKRGSYRIGFSNGNPDAGLNVEDYLVTPAIEISYNTPELSYETTRFIDPGVGS